MRRVCLVLAVLAALTGVGPGAAWGADVFAGHSGLDLGQPAPPGPGAPDARVLRAAGLRGRRLRTLLRTDDGGATLAAASRPGSPAPPAPRPGPRPGQSSSSAAAARCAAPTTAARTFRRLPWTASDTRCSSPSARSRSRRAQPAISPSRTATCCARSTAAGRGAPHRRARTAVTAAASKVAPRDVVFVTGDLGFALTSAGTMFRTRDGGGTWEPVLAAGAALDALSFSDAATGYAVGARSTLLRTTDGGRTWSPRPVPVVAELTSIHCAAPTCVATTSRGDQVLRSADGGDTWSSRRAGHGATRRGGPGHAVPRRRGRRRRDRRVVRRRRRALPRIGGRVEGSFDRPAGHVRRDRVRVRPQRVAGADDERRQELGRPRRGDVGRGRQRVVPATGDRLRARRRRRAAAHRQRRRSAGGSSTPARRRRPRAVLALDPRRVLLVGPAGIRRSTTGGQTFAPVPERSVRGAALDRIDRAGRALFASGSRVIFVSTSGGRRWTRVHRPAGSPIVKLDFVAPRTGFALLDDGRLMRTRDRGRAWTEVRALGTEVGTDIAFSDARHGYVTVAEFGDDDSGYVMATSDGGRRWRPQLVDSAALRRDALSAPSARSAFVLAGRDHLFATHRGGDLGSASRLTLSVARRAGSRSLREIRGRLRPARGGEQIVVSLRRTGAAPGCSRPSTPPRTARSPWSTTSAPRPSTSRNGAVTTSTAATARASSPARRAPGVAVARAPPVVDCRARWGTTVSGADDSRAFKDFEAAGWSRNAVGYGALTGRITAHVADPLLDAARVADGQTVLDVGCGRGDLCAAAADRGARPTGVDLADGMVAAARDGAPGARVPGRRRGGPPVRDGRVRRRARRLRRQPPAAPRARGGRVAPRRRARRPGRRGDVGRSPSASRSSASSTPRWTRRTSSAGCRSRPARPPTASPTTPSCARCSRARASTRSRSARSRSPTRSRASTSSGTGVTTGSVRTAAQLRALDDDERARVRGALDDLLEQRRSTGGLELETAVKIAVRDQPRGMNSGTSSSVTDERRGRSRLAVAVPVARPRAPLDARLAGRLLERARAARSLPPS